MTPPPCPCCTADRSTIRAAAESRFACPLCGHGWRPNTLAADHYRKLPERNPEFDARFERKLADRLQSIVPLLKDGQRILEIGCAEGRLGAAVKQTARVDYIGLEISPDADLAAARIDAVERRPASQFNATPFDLLLAFHVLEHIADIGSEIGHWSRLLAGEGVLIVEVPYRAGHPLLREDRHPEHLHCFTEVSITALLNRFGLETVRLSRGHFESPVYPDSLRVIARKSVDAATRRQRLIDRFRRKFDGEFVVYGTGGDFRNYVEPVLDALSVAALCDSSPAQHGTRIDRYTVCPYDPIVWAKRPILIASRRYQHEIANQLVSLGVPENAIIGLDDVYGDDA